MPRKSFNNPFILSIIAIFSLFFPTACVFFPVGERVPGNLNQSMTEPHSLESNTYYSDQFRISFSFPKEWGSIREDIDETGIVSLRFSEKSSIKIVISDYTSAQKLSKFPSQFHSPAYESLWQQVTERSPHVAWQDDRSFLQSSNPGESCVPNDVPNPFAESCTLRLINSSKALEKYSHQDVFSFHRYTKSYVFYHNAYRFDFRHSIVESPDRIPDLLQDLRARSDKYGQFLLEIDAFDNFVQQIHFYWYLAIPPPKFLRSVHKLGDTSIYPYPKMALKSLADRRLPSRVIIRFFTKQSGCVPKFDSRSGISKPRR